MDTVKTLINANIKTNGNQEITGLVLNGVLNAMVDSVDAQKQDLLSVEVLENGNIKLDNLSGGAREFMPATPSGDPMHFIYESAGAVWNNATGYWELNGLLDISNAQMRDIYNTIPFIPSDVSNNVGWDCYSYYTQNNIKARTTLPLSTPHSSSRLRCPKFTWNTNIEIIKFFKQGDSTSSPGILRMPNDAANYFVQCRQLKIIEDVLDFTLTLSTSHVFSSCLFLETVYVQNLKTSILFQNSRFISRQSLRYLVDNAANTSAITVTVHADVYAKLNDASLADWYQLRDDAIAKNISFATV